jgi:hypothetical protein
MAQAVRCRRNGSECDHVQKADHGKARLAAKGNRKEIGVADLAVERFRASIIDSTRYAKLKNQTPVRPTIRRHELQKKQQELLQRQRRAARKYDATRRESADMEQAQM